ncbi:papain family cysteine protease [Clostridium sp. CAG:632]|nr:papain family cysteine protease [Clostridium sp. CAG:632]
MKKLIGAIFVLVFAIMIIFSLTGHSEVQVKRTTARNFSSEFLSDLAEMDNQKGVSVVVGQETLSFVEEKPYVSAKGCLMFPVDQLTDAFNCSTQVYENGNILIEKGSNSISLYTNSAAANINGQLVELKDKVQIVSDKLYVPIGDIAQYINYDFVMNYKTASASMARIAAEVELPKHYDMRELERVTPVRDQGLYGTCWAFASLAALETTLTPQENLMFSPDHMSLCNSFSLGQNEGGEYTMAIAYMASWQGPVYESDDPYGDGKTNPDLKARKHLEEAQILAPKDYVAIKEAIYKYGAVETSIYTQMKTANSWSGYYNRERATYYYNQEATCNHDIIIVGWDDDFPKEYFTITPENDGAFICKNSWGTEFGEDGYFYVSYEDANIGTTNVVYTKLGDANNFDNIYQSDLLGWRGQLGYEKDQAYFANVYRAGEDEELAAVSFYATDVDTTYQVYVVPEFEDEDSLNDRKLVAEGSFEQAGYYTVRLDEAVKLKDNQKFAVVVHIQTPGAIHPVAIEYDADSRTREFDITDGEGYISLYGNKWMSAEKNKDCNLCLKAFTNDRSKK